MGRCVLLPLLLMLLPQARAQTTLATNNEYTCGNQCKFNNVNGTGWWMIRDQGGLCVVSCCPGYMQAQTGPGVYSTITNNIAYCTDPSTGWCVDGTPLYNPLAQPMELICQDMCNGYEIGYILPGLCPYPAVYTNSTTLPACYCEPARITMYGIDITNAFNIISGGITDTPLCPSVAQSHCQNGCGYNFKGDPLPYILTDDGTNCEVVCPIGILQGSANYVNIDPANNLIACQDGNDWCYSGGTAGSWGTYWCNVTTTYVPIVRGGMTTCTTIASDAAVVIDCSTYTNATVVAACDVNYPTTTTETTTVTTTPTTTTETTTLSTSTETSTSTGTTTTGPTTTGPTTTGTTGTGTTTTGTTGTGTTTTGTTGTGTTTTGTTGTGTTTTGTTGTGTTTTGTTGTGTTTTGTTGTETTTTGTTGTGTTTTGTTGTGTTTTGTTGTGTTTTGTTNTGTTTSTTAGTGTSTSAAAATTQQESETTLDPSAPLGMCSPFVAANGVTYDNRCTQYDAGATCSDDGDQATCTCSAGQTGSTCGVSETSLQSLAQLEGSTANAQTVQNIYSMITQSKGGGTATFTSNMPSLFSFMTDAQKAELSYAATDMLIDATYEGKSLNVNNAFTTFYDPSLGNCFTFNHYNCSFHYGARMIGPAGGLKVQLNVMPDEYMPFIDTMGINVYIAQIGDHIYVESNKIMSQPGGWDKIMLTRTTTQLLETRKSKCAEDTSSAQSYYFDGNYSIDGCYRSCYQDSCYAACGCMDPMYSRKDGVSACTFEQVPCILEMQERRGDPSTWPECSCYQPCYSQDYAVSYSRGLLTNQMVCAQTGEFNATSGCKPSESYVTVGFKTLEAQVQVEVPRYPLSRMFGNFGNVGGLLLGFSMVALFEWLFFAINMFLIMIKQEKHAPSAGEVRKDY